MKNWNYINGAEIGNEIPNSQINGPSASEIREIAGRVYKTDMRKDDLARAVSFELAKKYKSFQTNSHIMDMVSEVLSKFKIGNETMREWATSKPRNVGNKGRINYDDDLVVVKHNGTVTYKGLEDYEPDKYSPWKYNESKGVYELPGGWTKEKVGNTKVINSDREFFKELADDAKKEEKKDDAEIEKVGNRIIEKESEMSQELKNLLKTAPAWVKEKINYAFSHGFTIDEGEFIKAIKKEAGNAKCGNSIMSEYNAEIQRLTRKAEQLRRMGQGKSAMEVEKQIEKLGKELYEYDHKPTKNSASDDKFAYVMREFDEGKLKTPDGKVVTDPAQAKAIAYSESKKAENGLARARNAIKKS